MAILVNEKRDVQINGDFKTSGFKIQASAKAFEILSSNIYEHKVRAVIREYNCNAYDAHVLAGNEQPWDVHLPTHLEPYFSVRDYGTGLSDEQMRQVFTTYFDSTKIHSNEFIGGLGLGSKSAFSLVDSFTVVSYYNGSKSDYSCYKDKNGEPQLALLCETDTDEPNGLEVSMSVDGRSGEFAVEAVRVFKYFDVLPNINDQEVVRDIQTQKDEYDFVTEDMSLRNDWGNLYAVMGNVAYQIPSEFGRDLSGFIRFDIGELSFNAGREKLSLDDDTKLKLRKRVDDVQNQLAQIVYDQIEAEPCSFKRAELVAKSLNGNIKSITRKSDLDFSQFELPSIPDDQPRMTIYSRSNWYRDTTDVTSNKRLPLGVDNWTVRYFLHADRMKTRIMSWMKEQRNVKLVILTQEQVDFFGIPADKIEVLEDVVPKLARSHRGSSPSRSKVSKWNGQTSGWRKKAGECWNDVEVDNDGDEKVYVEISRYETTNCSWDMGQFKNVLDSLDHLGIGIEGIYGLKSAFLKTKGFKSGNWISLDQYVIRERAKLPQITLLKKNRNYNDYNSLFKKLGEKVDNELISDYNNTVESLKSEHSDRFAYETLHISEKIKYEDTLGDLSDKIVEKFPVIKLLPSCGSYASDEQIEIVVNYIQGDK
jgi:hypothetical protein